ncbi:MULTISPECIES: hypothetical protein [unclassified Cryobacterium]|uniref:hypothetical protein n=1 Tax=unclassified Cryobacterium TaxID=2649013 RepID=UPI002AB59534|nr:MULTISPECIES: hypothetical protein [unclassified Cryobacterium]MDY7529245.1 hypothetical protein [Cryobacterium sp. 10C2]MDY7558593.1 hypothetical protein [Cryobacterium sp. 10C3]MEB0289724.1 hypothetical protein [Cryobacterium sp. 10C2]MEB0304135.1 hypothetical protein [Cryobacterium sp. 10I1]
MENERLAEEALAVADASRRVAVRRSRSPWWYYPADGVVIGAAAVAVLLAEGIGRSIAVLAMVVSTTLLEIARRAVTGTRTTEFGHGRATGYAVVFAILSLATLAAGWYFVIKLGVTWVAWVAGAVVCVLLVASGWVFERTLSSSMRR